MVETDVAASVPDEDAAAVVAGPRRRRGRIVGIVLALVLVAALAATWLSRERIAGNVIAGQVETLGLPATYRIVSIGARRQVIADIVVGDPARPDLTIERAEVEIVPRIGAPGIRRILLVKPRLYGAYRDGKLSFGSLDTVLFGGPRDQPLRLPDLDLAIQDGRGLMVTDWGPVGIKAEGAGKLRGGFAGVLAAVAPAARAGPCRIERASLYGTVRITAEQPRFLGPARMAALDCGDGATRIADAAVQVDATLDKTFAGVTGRLGLRAARIAQGPASLDRVTGTASFVNRAGRLSAHYDLAADALASPQARLSDVRLDGRLRGADGLARLDAEGTLVGRDLRTGDTVERALADAARAGQGTLLAPLATQMRAALLRESPGSALSLQFMARHAPGQSSLVVPQGTLRGGSGAALVEVSRVQALFAGGLPRIAGNFTTGGPGLPRISGRMDQSGAGSLVMRLAMADYRAGTASLGVPRLLVVQDRDGIGFAGEVRVSGDLPGGRSQGLVAPVDGNWSGSRGLALWRRCTAVRFEGLAFANLTLDRRALTLCPPRGGAIVRSDRDGTRIAAGAPALGVSGRLGSTPIRIASGPVGFAVPGNLSARALDVSLGPPATASRFRIADLTARIGSDVAGRFAGTDVLLAAVPLDIREASGDWRYAGGRLSLTSASFRLTDRQADARFQPLAAQDATLSLANNRIDAAAVLREPASGREVVRTAIRHDLGSGRGDADLLVDGLMFDDAVQPDTLTRRALGVVANVKGSVRGTGRIDWNADRVTSTGRFTTDSLDLAAAFGPVQGLSGTVEFTDLLGLVTAPGQTLRLATINPGIEVADGAVTFELRPNSQIAVKGGSWPFFGGTLKLQPVTMNMGVAETRRYELVIEGLDSAKLAQRMNMANIAITGTFDGTLPLVFDENGGTIVGGQLQSRSPGGNLSYVGELTYKDLSPMANYAFATLRSLDYRSMRVEMEGPLAGEIITRLKFDGVRQGAGAKRNFLTDRIGKLPIRFNVNIKAPFFQLVTSLRSIYDPAYVRDPRELGLLGADGRPLPPGAPATLLPELPINQPDIQPPASGAVP